MKTGVVILCRYDSSRLPGKILKQIQGKPILQYIYERVSGANNVDTVIVATSSESSDDPIVAYCQNNHINYYRGSKNNVAERFLGCAISYQLDYVVRINGDNLFTDSKILCQMINIASADKYDFISNVKGRTFPRGMSIEILRTSFYENLIKKFTKPEHFEHVTLFLYEQENIGRQYHYLNQTIPEAVGVNLAIDTLADFTQAERLISQMGKDHTQYHLREIVSLVSLLEEAKNEHSLDR